jgi:hypothetical protein
VVLTDEKQKRLASELESLLNRLSVDNDLNTPDYILARYLVRCLENLQETTKGRDTHEGRWWDRWYEPEALVY